MVKWVNTKGWLNGYRPKKDLSQPEILKPTDAQELNQDSYGVIYRPIRCPKCSSKNVKCYSSAPPIRYHKCRSCGWKFKSWESDD